MTVPNRRLTSLLVGVLAPLLTLGAEAESAPSADAVYARANATAGVVVCLGCERSSEVIALKAGPRRLVLAFGRGLGVVQRCRAQLAAEGVLGYANAVVLHGDRLPLREHSVNLVVARRPLGVALAEMQRVLVPGGALCLKRGDGWRVVRKERPDDIDDWTHFLYDSSNNAVSRDRRVAPAERLQWTDGPLWTRSHDFLSTFAVAVSDGGRLFSILDEAPVASAMIPPQWMLVCRDAFNGVVLWKRQMTDWFNSMYPMRSGPNHLLRRLVAADDKVFVTLGQQSPVSVLDAATGETVRELSGTEHTEEILYRDGCLCLALNPDPKAESEAYYRSTLKRLPLPAVPAVRKTLLAVDVETGSVLWRKSDADTTPVIELTLAVVSERVYYATDQALVCLDRNTGTRHWQTELSVELRRPTWSVPTLAVYKDIVFFGDRSVRPDGGKVGRETMRKLMNGNVAGEVIALNAADGRRLWSCPSHDGFHLPVEVFVENDRVWTGAVAYRDDPGYVQARDYRTGEVVFERDHDPRLAVGHHRCHRNKATARFITMGRGFVEWVDLTTGEYLSNVFLRGACSFGMLPANGLLYVPPDPCICGTQFKMRGLCAVAGGQASGVKSQVSGPELHRGPAYQKVIGHQSPVISRKTDRRSLITHDWPVYRHDNGRSAVTSMELAVPIKLAWQQSVADGKLTAPTAIDGKLVLASIDTHTVYCLDAQNGERCWQFIAGGRIDTPPTLHGGRAIFGGRDGCLYAVDLGNGQLEWQLDLNPGAARIHAFGQLESVQPLTGSVLTHGEFLYVVTGRSSLLDGGLHFYKIRAADGHLAATRRLTGKPGSVDSRDALLPDLLTGTADGFYLRNRKFSYDDLSDLRRVGDHLWSPTGLLDATWLHRTYWVYGTQWGRNWPLRTKRLPVPAGRLLCIDAAAGIIYGFGRNKYGWGIRPDRWQSGDKHYQAHATPIGPMDAEDEPKVRRGTALPRTPLWSVKSQVEARAMAVTRGHGLIAGPRGKPTFLDAAFRGKEGIGLQVLDKTTGKLCQELPLPAMPAFDGLITAFGRVYLALRDGSVVCYEGSPRR